jgi:PAS domain S-box-containing protein
MHSQESPTIQQQDALFRLLVQNVEDYAIFLMDPTGHIQTWNEGAERILGYSTAEIIGKHHALFYPPSELRRGKPAYVLSAAGEEGRFEEEHWRIRKDGTRFWASVVITALRGPAGEVAGFAKVVRDLTARKQAEDDRNVLLSLERGARARTEQVLEQLRAIESITEAALAHLDLDSLLQALLDRLADILEVDTVAVLLLTDDGQWLVPRAARGIEEEVEAGIPLPLGRGFAGRIAAERHPIILDDLEHSDVLNPILRQKGVKSVLGVPLIVEGRPLGVLHVGTLHPRRFTDEDVRFLQIAADRAALAIEHARLYETAERARQAAEAAVQEVRLRDEFLSVAAHELRTPITGLRAAAQVLLRPLLRGDPVTTDRLMRMATVIDQESDKLARLVSQLLDLSRLEGGRFPLDRTDFDVVALVRAVGERMQAQAPTAEIQVQAAGSLWIWADPLRIEQVLLNLLDNAVKYSPRGGEIVVECSQPTSDVVRIAVRDHGIGLAATEQEPVFERFYQVDASERTTGLGLGLYISREIVDRHGGRIWAESPPDGGTRFVLELPAGPTQESPRSESVSAQRED